MLALFVVFAFAGRPLARRLGSPSRCRSPLWTALYVQFGSWAFCGVCSVAIGPCCLIRAFCQEDLLVCALRCGFRAVQERLLDLVCFLEEENGGTLQAQPRNSGACVPATGKQCSCPFKT